MTLKQYIKDHRKELVEYISQKVSAFKKHRISDKEIRLWLLNDYNLYTETRTHGVKI